MSKKPYSNELVMASIESLYQQAVASMTTDADDLGRGVSFPLPIVGSLPVESGEDRLDDNSFYGAVLTGLLAISPNKTKPDSKQATSDEDNSEAANDPLLAIRQAVFSAGEPANTDVETPFVEKQAFAGQLAQLVDREVERRLAEQLDAQKNNSSAQNRKVKAAKKAKNTRNSTTKTKKDSGRKTATKKITKPRRKATT